MRLLFTLFFLSVFSLEAQAQFFDAQGEFLPQVTSADDSRIGWKMVDYSQAMSGAATLAGPYGKNSYELFCSGSLVSARNASEQSPVYVVSNGHCSGLLDDFLENPKLKVRHKSFPDRTVALMKNFINIPRDKNVPIEMTEIIYASMNTKDIMIAKTDKNVGEIKKMGFKIYHFSDTAANGKLTSIGTPLSGRDPEYVFQHQSECSTFGTVTLFEGPITSLALRHNCSTVGGQSGSSMFNGAGDIAALAFTGYEADAPGKDCDMSKPCELTKSGSKKSFPNYSYAIPVHGLNACFSDKGVFEGTEKCGL